MNNDEKILPTLRTVCGLSNDDSFDSDLIVHSGGAFANMSQVGVGFRNFVLKDDTQKWSDLLGPEAMATPIFPAARQYTQLYVRQLFDPPAPTTVTYMDKVMSELLWRLQMYADELLLEGGIINGNLSE